MVDGLRLGKLLQMHHNVCTTGDYSSAAACVVVAQQLSPNEVAFQE